MTKRKKSRKGQQGSAAAARANLHRKVLAEWKRAEEVALRSRARDKLQAEAAIEAATAIANARLAAKMDTKGTRYE